ncbi:hypothetical protein V9T40_001513 [Parthenolecanium corni]|uniref:Uncharacterized protein n=1 Tax=Parthenolecanium corni TaxID=536013 RepID=A0AAN9Y6M8_9HEMI
MERKVRINPSKINLTIIESGTISNNLKFQKENLTIEINQDLSKSEPGTSKQNKPPGLEIEPFEIIKMCDDDKPIFRANWPSPDQMKKFFPNKKVSTNFLKSKVEEMQEIKNKIFLQELCKIETNDTESEKEIVEAKMILDRNYSLDSYFLETVISSAFLLNLSNEEIHELTTAIDPPEQPLDEQQRDLCWVNGVAIEYFRNKLQYEGKPEILEKFMYDKKHQGEAYPISSSEYNKRTVVFTPTFQGDWFKEFLNESDEEKPNLNEFPVEWIEKCHKLVKRDMDAIIEVKKITLEDLKEVLNMHKLILSYYDNLAYFNELLKIEIIQRTIKIEDKESVLLRNISEDIFSEEQSNILKPCDMPKPSSREIEEENTSNEKVSSKIVSEIEKKPVAVKIEPTKQIEPINQNPPTQIEIEMIKLKELPVEAVIWLRLNPMLATKAMCHLNPDLKPSLVGNNVIELKWIKNPRDAKILEKPIEDRVVTIDKKPCAVMDITKMFTIELYDPLVLDLKRVMRCTVHVLPPKQHTRRFALERIELGRNFLVKYLTKVDTQKRKIFLKFENGEETSVPFDLKRNTT